MGEIGKQWQIVSEGVEKSPVNQKTCYIAAKWDN
jgi:hypothetical protein